MTYKKTYVANASSLDPGYKSRDGVQNHAYHQPDEKPPRKPDWLLLLIGVLFLLTVLIAWLADIPTMFR